MPVNPRPYCAYPLCNRQAEPGSSYCNIHNKNSVEFNSQGISPGIAPHAPDMRPSASSRGYDRTWKKVRKIKLAINPLCEECLKAGIVKQAEEVHHIKPVADYPELRLAIDNLQSLCKTCHNKKTAEEKKNRKKDGVGGENP